MITEDSLSSTVVSSVPSLVETSVSTVQPSICTIHPPLVTAQASISTVQLSATPSSNIPFRGHCDSNDASTESVNKGNFKAILDFRAKGDPVLQAHLATGPRNAAAAETPKKNGKFFLTINGCKKMISALLNKISNC